MVYDVGISGESWDPLLERMTGLFDGTATVFFVQDQHAAGLQFSRLWGLPTSAMAEFEERYASIDVGLDTLLSQPAGSIITDESTAREVYRSSEIYNDFRRRWESERYIACDVFRDPRRFGVLAVQGSTRRAPFAGVERDLLRRLLPHLRRSVQMRAHLQQRDARHRTLEDLVEHALVGVLLLDGAGHVTYANAAARRIDGMSDGLSIARGRLVAALATDDRALRQTIAAALQTAAGAALDPGAPVRVRRLSGGRPFSLLVTPAPRPDSAAELRGGAAAVVLIGDPDAGPRSTADVAAALYALTPAEARLACAVAAGDSLETYADRQGITLSTARWTMKQVLHKTDTSRQADLVRLLLTGPVALATRDREPQ